MQRLDTGRDRITDSGRFAALLAGERGASSVSLDLYDSNIRGERLRLLEAFSEPSVSLDNNRDWAWELSTRVEDNRGLDPYSMWVKAVMSYEVGGGRHASFSLGLYRFSGPKNEHDIVTKTSLTGRSPESLLADDHEEGGYLIPAGTGVLNAARVLMIASGIPATRIQFPTEDVILTTPMWFDPDQDASSVNKLNIVNTLLVAGAFENLYTTSEGVFATQKVAELVSQEPEVFYTSEPGLYVPHSRGELLGEQLIRTQPISDDYDDENFANKVTVQSGDANQIPPVRVTVVNDDPASPFSTANRAVKAAPIITLDNVASAAEAFLIARNELAKAGGYYRTISFTTPADPRRGPREAAMVHALAEDGAEFVSGKWRYLGFQTDEVQTTHELARIEGAPQGVEKISSIGPAAIPNFVYGDGEWAGRITFTPDTFRYWGQTDIELEDIEETFDELG